MTNVRSVTVSERHTLGALVSIHIQEKCKSVSIHEQKSITSRAKGLGCQQHTTCIQQNMLVPDLFYLTVPYTDTATLVRCATLSKETYHFVKKVILSRTSPINCVDDCCKHTKSGYLFVPRGDDAIVSSSLLTHLLEAHNECRIVKLAVDPVNNSVLRHVRRSHLRHIISDVVFLPPNYLDHHNHRDDENFFERKVVYKVVCDKMVEWMCLNLRPVYMNAIVDKKWKDRIYVREQGVFTGVWSRVYQFDT